MHTKFKHKDVAWSQMPNILSKVYTKPTTMSKTHFNVSIKGFGRTLNNTACYETINKTKTKTKTSIENHQLSAFYLGTYILFLLNTVNSIYIYIFIDKYYINDVFFIFNNIYILVFWCDNVYGCMYANTYTSDDAISCKLSLFWIHKYSIMKMCIDSFNFFLYFFFNILETKYLLFTNKVTSVVCMQQMDFEL